MKLRKKSLKIQLEFDQLKNDKIDEKPESKLTPGKNIVISKVHNPDKE